MKHFLLFWERLRNEHNARAVGVNKRYRWSDKEYLQPFFWALKGCLINIIACILSKHPITSRALIFGIGMGIGCFTGMLIEYYICKWHVYRNLRG